MQKLKNNEARPKFTGSFNPIPPGEGEGRGGGKEKCPRRFQLSRTFMILK